MKWNYHKRERERERETKIEGGEGERILRENPNRNIKYPF